MINEKYKKMIESKNFIPIFVILINLSFFIICNVLFKLTYETIDDYNIFNILSKADGSYNFYTVYIHPILSYIIMLLYKTGININWYTIFILLLQFVSFTVIGIIFLKKNKVFGTFCYIFIISTIYSRLLLIINYTSIAAITILAGIILLIYYNDTQNDRNKILGFVLITVGTMLRWKSAIIVLPFYIVYTFIYSFTKKEYTTIKILGIIVLIIFSIYITNDIIYKINPIYKKYTEFNNVRTYFFDSNVLNYEEYKEILNKQGWSNNDLEVLYTYSFADEEFYTTDNLRNLKDVINNSSNFNINIILNTIKLLYILTRYKYLILFIMICLILIFSYILNKNKLIIIAYFFTFLLINFMLCYMKPTYRVIIPLYGTTFVMMIYILLNKSSNKQIPSKYDKCIEVIISIVALLVCILDGVNVYKMAVAYSKEDYSIIKEIINYTSANSQNAYVYPNVFGNVSLAYSIYEKIPDNTLSNLRYMGEWDIYNKEYYLFKEKYGIDNIMSDLYKKDNLYIITGNNISKADNSINSNHIETIKQYIKEHFNKEIEYKVIKEFNKDIKIYKIYEE